MCSLDTLPVELFHLLCLYLNASDVLALKSVCKRISSFLGSTFWKKRVLSLCVADFPCIPGKPVDWISSAVEREYTLNLFKPDGHHAHYVQPYAAAQGIDAIHIPPDHPDLLLIGDRGRTLTGYSINRLHQNGSLIQAFIETQTHMGWIWTIKSCKDVVATGSWDGVLRSWTINTTGLMLDSAFKLHRPVLCSTFLDPNTIAVSAHLFVHILDLRVPPEQQARGLILRHQKAVLCIDSVNEHCGLNGSFGDGNLTELRASGDQQLSSYQSFSSLSSITNSDPGLDPRELISGLEGTHVSEQSVDLGSGDQVLDCPFSDPRAKTTATNPSPPQGCTSARRVALYTGSDDHFLAGWDLRNPSKPAVRHQFANYPRKMSLMDSTELWVAEPPGRIHVFDIRHGHLECVHVNELPGWSRGFGGLEATPGGVYACGLHGVVDVFHPTVPIMPIGRKPIAEGIPGSPTSMAYHHGILTVGGGDGSVYIWTSKDRIDSAATMSV